MTQLHRLRRALLSAGGRYVIDGGSYNSSVHWILYSNGILKIYGTGKTIPPTKPWAEYISKIEEIVIDEGITTFSWNYNEGQFNGCANVRKITLPSTLTEIDSNNTFANCTKLKEVVAPNGVPFNGNRFYTFLNCKSLETIQISTTSSEINSSAFSGCTGLTSITIPDSVTSIGSSAFSGCASLTSVTFGDSVTSIGSSAFSGCTNLALTELPSGVTSIGNEAFRYCGNLALTELPSGVTSIGTKAFEKCTNLALTSLPSGLTSIRNEAFSGCKAITNIVVPNGVTNTMDSVFFGCTGATIIYGTGVTSCTNTPRTNNQHVIFLGNITDFGSYSMLYINNAIVEFRNNTVVPSITNFGSTYTGTKKIIVPDALYDEWIAAPVWNTHPEWIIKASEV